MLEPNSSPRLVRIGRHRFSAALVALGAAGVLGTGGCGGSGSSGSNTPPTIPSSGDDASGGTPGEDAAPVGSNDAAGGGSKDGGTGVADTGGGGGNADAPGTPPGDGSSGSPSPDGSTGSSDGGTGTPVGDGGDGTPVRNMCTSNFGSGMTAVFGRIDGFLVSIVVPGTSGCNGDADHVHLQVLMSGSVYDVAVNVLSNQGDGGVNSEVLYLEHPLTSVPDGPWSEGWHTTDSFDYVTTLGVKSTDFTATPMPTLAMEVENRLANVNHISVFETGYGSTGGHLIHRNLTGQDGAIITEPLSATPHALLFHFSGQTF